MLFGCATANVNSNDYNQSSISPTTKDAYGVYLGENGSNTDKLLGYKNLIIDLDEFSTSNIASIKEAGCKIYSYLSVGSLEKYRSYYEEYKDITFMDYDNWPDERWVDVSNHSWQRLNSGFSARDPGPVMEDLGVEIRLPPPLSARLFPDFGRFSAKRGIWS